MNSIHYFTQNAVWINESLIQYKINFKPYQLLLAKEIGFLIPDTKITNNSYDILSQFNDYKRVI
ncbi:hypothetical protein OCC47_20705 [Bacillus cereus]|nr:hypothetical protein [Bacillus cereus]